MNLIEPMTTIWISRLFLAIGYEVVIKCSGFKIERLEDVFVYGLT